MTFVDDYEKYLDEAAEDKDVPRFLEGSAYDIKMCNKVADVVFAVTHERENYDLHHLFFAWMQYLSDTYHLTPEDLEAGAQIYLHDIIAAGQIATDSIAKTLQNCIQYHNTREYLHAEVIQRFGMSGKDVINIEDYLKK